MALTPTLVTAIKRVANQIGIDPTDLATVISYETAGTFDPWKAGPTTQWGQHRGLIQWGEPQRRQYGVSANSSIDEQMDAVARYLVDNGVRPGMGIMDVYSAINAGEVGLYNASDGPGNAVSTHVARMMAEHRPNVADAFGGSRTVGKQGEVRAPANPPPGVPMEEYLRLAPGQRQQLWADHERYQELLERPAAPPAAPQQAAPAAAAEVAPVPPLARPAIQGGQLPEPVAPPEIPVPGMPLPAATPAYAPGGQELGETMGFFEYVPGEGIVDGVGEVLALPPQDKPYGKPEPFHPSTASRAENVANSLGYGDKIQEAWRRYGYDRALGNVPATGTVAGGLPPHIPTPGPGGVPALPFTPESAGGADNPLLPPSAGMSAPGFSVLQGPVDAFGMAPAALGELIGVPLPIQRPSIPSDYVPLPVPRPRGLR